MITPKGRKYANTTERTLAAEKRIKRVVRGLVKLVEGREDGKLVVLDDRRIKAGRRLLKDMGG